MKHQILQLGVNVDHVATLRQARGIDYPDPVDAADIARKAGADSITIHLREDRRHIQDADVERIRENIALPMNLEIAATQEMLQIAQRVCPDEVMLVPEKREELTTEGGLDVVNQTESLQPFLSTLKHSNIRTSLFIDPDFAQIDASVAMGADVVELHTGQYAEAQGEQQKQVLERIQVCAVYAQQKGLQVHAGHGLHYQNVMQVAAIEPIECLNIGHSIVSRAVMTGFHEAVFCMKRLMINARLGIEEPARNNDDD